ncbi:MAG: DUF4351 domain-containing protein [Cyanobacteria bacterium]|nr:DUF4351 domain-containing protein [Cyanobacteriota bacterium]MDW8202041.1 DUF4351 domain-containing protein [Cyanobacteriota bacterium SKYGB_h_bin112]
MSFDNLCKLLSEKYPNHFTAWLIGGVPARVDVLKTELGIEPIRADSVTFLTLRNRILHLEFQTRLDSDPPLPLRMLDYWVRLYRLYRLPITQIIIFLTPPPGNEPIPTSFRVETTCHEYRIVKMWEQDPTIFLQTEALLPLAPLAATSNPQQLLAQVAQQVNAIQSNQKRQEVSSYTQILAGLRFEKSLIRQLFQENAMRESVIYQDILQQGEQKGLQRGIELGREEGRLEGRLEGQESGERSLVLRQLTRRFGELPEPLVMTIAQLALPQLESLAEALIDFTTKLDLVTWLLTHRLGELPTSTKSQLQSATATQLETLVTALPTINSQSDLEALLSQSPQ